MPFLRSLSPFAYQEIGLNIFFLRVFQVLQCPVISQMWHKKQPGVYQKPKCPAQAHLPGSVVDTYQGLGKSINQKFNLLYKFSFWLAVCTNQLQNWNVKENQALLLSKTKGIFSIGQMLPFFFHFNPYRLWVLCWCTASNLFMLWKHLVLRKVDIYLVAFPFANDRIGYHNFFKLGCGRWHGHQCSTPSKRPNPFKMWGENTILLCTYWSTNWQHEMLIFQIIMLYEITLSGIVAKRSFWFMSGPSVEQSRWIYCNESVITSAQ